MKGLLRFITCGSVDDGKSTLIGHLLYDSKLVYTDQEEALKLYSAVGSAGGDIDYSLLLDGLMAEREQGITIDVAYRYFTTDNRSFIVADTPGHEEYTRNMAVGASFAELAVILLDATKGVLIQTRRHARICALMGIKNFVFAVNKMDLAGYDKKTFDEIVAQINELEDELGIKGQIIPVSATVGDNVTVHGDKMPWYEGDTLLTYLENVDVYDSRSEKGFCMPVQRVCRPDHSFRGFQGQIEAGKVSIGDKVCILPSGEYAGVERIYIGDKESDKALTGQPATICLDREIDVSRGDVMTDDPDTLKTGFTFDASLLWMDDDTLIPGKNFFIKIGTHMVPGQVTEIKHQIDINTGEKKKTASLRKNEIAVCRISLTDKTVLDVFSKHKALGELILIDRISNMTSACGIVEEVFEKGASSDERVTINTRARIKGQKALVAGFNQSSGLKLDDIREVEKLLIKAGRHTYLYYPSEDDAVGEVLLHLYRAGVIVLFACEETIDTAAIDKALPKGAYYHDIVSDAGAEPEKIVKYILMESVPVGDASGGLYI